MKVIQAAEDFKLENQGRLVSEFEKGKFYIMSDAYKDQISKINENVLGIEMPFSEVYNKYKGEDLNNRKIIMLRHGGGGDILFMLTGIEFLLTKYPASEINVAIGESYRPLTKYRPLNVFNLPIALETWNDFHYHLIFENLIEHNPIAKEYNAYDLFMMEMGLDVVKEVAPEHKIPYLFVGNEERESVLEQVSVLRSNKRKIGIQIASSSKIRNYPAENYIKVCSYLKNCGYDIYIFGSPIQRPLAYSLARTIGSNCYDATNENLRSSIVLASFMDCFIAPDSMFIHIAAALNIPVIGIYGPFHSAMRMKYFRNAIGIDVEVGCSPCFKHGRAPCAKGDPSPCFSVITPEIIIEAFEKKIKGELWNE